MAKLGGTFGSVKQLTASLGDGQKKELGGRSGVYRAVRALGFRFREPKTAQVESERLKDARVLYFDQYLRDLQDDSTDVCHFDWTSFSPGNFKRRQWGRVGVPNVVEERYQYTKLHFLALLDSKGGVVGQFVQGSLNQAVVFCFVRDAVLKLRSQASPGNNRLLIVLDNSPFNHSLPLKLFAVQNQV